MQNSSGMLKGREVCSNAYGNTILYGLNHLNESLADVGLTLVTVTFGCTFW